MINTDAACERNVQDAAGQSGYAIGDLFRIDFHSHIHRHECDGELLRRRLRRVLVDVRICATHTAYIVGPYFATCNCCQTESVGGLLAGSPRSSRTNGTKRTGTVSYMSTRKASCFITSLST